MARRKTTFKLDVKELEQDIALAKVVGASDRESTIRDFCKMYSVPIAEEFVNDQVLVLTEMKKALDQETKSSSKK